MRPSAARPTAHQAPLGERLLRELQLQTPRRAAQRRGLLQPPRGRGADRELATALQHRAAAQLSGLRPARAGSGPAPQRIGRALAGCASFGRRAPGQPRRGAQACAPLTFRPGHPTGTGHSPDLNLIEKVFAKLKHLIRKAQPRDVEATWRKVGQLLDLFSPSECANYLLSSGYGSS